MSSPIGVIAGIVIIALAGPFLIPFLSREAIFSLIVVFAALACARLAMMVYPTVTWSQAGPVALFLAFLTAGWLRADEEPS